MSPQPYRIRHDQITAIQWDGGTASANAIMRWSEGLVDWDETYSDTLELFTENGLIPINTGDWLLKDAAGDWVITPDEKFRQKYK